MDNRFYFVTYFTFAPNAKTYFCVPKRENMTAKEAADIATQHMRDVVVGNELFDTQLNKYVIQQIGNMSYNLAKNKISL
jgi:hypothetical protein